MFMQYQKLCFLIHCRSAGLAWYNCMIMQGRRLDPLFLCFVAFYTWFSPHTPVGGNSQPCLGRVNPVIFREK